MPIVSLVVSIAGLVWLVILASSFGDSIKIVTSAIFGVSLICLYVIYVVFNIVRNTKHEEVIKKFRNMTSYVLISATYTPIYLASFPPAWGWSMFGISWGITLIGIFFYFFKSISRKVHTVIYILVDWIIVIAFVPLYDSLPFFAIKILTLGSACYTMSAIMERIGKVYWAQLNMLLGSLLHIYFIYLLMKIF